MVFQAEGVDLREVGAGDVRAAEGVVVVRGGGGCYGGREGVPWLRGHVDAHDEVVVREAAEEIGEQGRVLRGEPDGGGLGGVVVGAAAEEGEHGGEVDDVRGDGEGGFEAADQEGDGWGVGVGVGVAEVGLVRRWREQGGRTWGGRRERWVTGMRTPLLVGWAVWMRRGGA